MPLARLAGLGLAFALLATLVSIAVPADALDGATLPSDVPPGATVVSSPVGVPVPFRVEVQHVVAPESSSLAPHPVHGRRLLVIVVGLAMWVGLVLGACAVFGRDRRAIVAVAGWGLWPTIVFSSASAAVAAPLGAIATGVFVLAFGRVTGRLTASIAIGGATVALIGGIALLVGGLVPFVRPDPAPLGLHRVGTVAADAWLGAFAPTGDAFGGVPRLVKLACWALSGAIVGGACLAWRDRQGATRPVLLLAGGAALVGAAWTVWGDRTLAFGWTLAALPLAILATIGLTRLVGPRATTIALGVGPLVATALTIAFDVLPHYHVPIAKWARGDVLRYDDAGNPRLSPHRVLDPATADLEMWGSYAPGRQPAMSAACGLPEVRFRYTRLDPRVPLQVRVTYFGGQEAGKFGIVPVQELWAGDVRVHGPIAVTFQPRELAWALPQGVVGADGTLELRFRGVDGSPSAVAEVWIERPWVSAKRITPKRTAGDQVVAMVELANRDPEVGHPVEIALARRVDGRVERLVAQTTSNPIPAGEPYGVGIAAPPGAARTGDELVVGLRRRDRAPWAIFKGATCLGPGGAKKGDLAARDLHVAARRANTAEAVFRTDIDAPPGPWVVDVRYRATTAGVVRFLDRAGETLATRPLDPADGYRAVRIGVREAGNLARIEVAFTGEGPAAVDELAVWADGDETGVHLYPAGRVPARP